MTEFDRVAGELLEYVMAALHDAQAADAKVSAQVGKYLDDLAQAREDEEVAE